MNRQRYCLWCGEWFEQLDPDYWFCNDECEQAYRELENCKQRNCQWCYERIETRIFDLYCSVACKEQHVRSQQLAKRRRVIAWVLYIIGVFGCLASIILLHHQVPNVDDSNLLLRIMGFPSILMLIWILSYIRDAYIGVIQSISNRSLNRYLGYQCVCSWFRVRNDNLFIKNFCCAGKKCEHDYSLNTKLYSSLIDGIVPLSVLLSLIGVSLASLDHGLELTLVLCFQFLGMTGQQHFLSHIDEYRLRTIGLSKNKHEALKIAGREVCGHVRGDKHVLDYVDNYFGMTPDELINKCKEIILGWFEVNRMSEITFYRLQKELQGKLVCNVHDVKVLPKNVYDFYVKVENLSDMDVAIEKITISGKSSKVTKSVSGHIPSGQSKVIHFRHNSDFKLAKLKNVTVDIVSVEQYPQGLSLDSTVSFNPTYDKFLKLIGHERQIPA